MRPKFLIIVESPSKIRLIEKYLGSDYCVIASRGHICNIEKLNDINVKGDFETKYKVMNDKKKLVSEMRLIIDRYNFKDIYIGTDDDVEGEKIGYDICSVFNLPITEVKRIYFNEITECALKNSIKNSRHINMNVVKSQQARQILDMLIGYNISPMLWKHIHHPKSKTLSAGRCQSSALSLIYDNAQKCNENRIDKSYRTVIRIFEHPFTIEGVLSEHFAEECEIRNFLELSKRHLHVVSLSKKNLTLVTAPQPLNTSKMIQISSEKYKNSPSMTMKLAQKLYQDGMITYIRTESKKYSQEFLSKSEKFISEKYGKSFVGSNDKISNIASKLPHEAIRVTDLSILKINGEVGLQNIYSLIYKNTIESCMSDAVFDSYDIVVDAPLDYKYLKRIDVRQFDGWLRFSGKLKDEPDYYTFVNSLNVKTINYHEITSNFSMTKHHTHYSDVELIKRLEELGIGRPSTYAHFIDVNLECGYIKKENIDGLKVICTDFKLQDSCTTESKIEKTLCSERDKLIIQETGRLCMDFLKEYYKEFFDYSFTKRIEDVLDGIKEDSLNWSNICRQSLEELKTSSKNINEKSEHVLDDSNTLKYLRFGPVIEHVNKNNGEHEYLSINPNIKIDNGKLKRNEYSVQDLTEYSDSFIGDYNKKPINLMSGKYGPYLRHNLINYKIKDININLDEAINIINKEVEPHCSISNKIMRNIDINTSIRKGKDGKPYIYYKTKNIPKPLFFNLKDVDLLTCETSIIITFLTKKCAS